MALQDRMDYLAQDPDAFSVDYAYLLEFFLARRFQVVVQKVLHFFWPEGMQVDRSLRWGIGSFRLLSWLTAWGCQL